MSPVGPALVLGTLLAACTSQPDSTVDVGEVAVDAHGPSITVPSSAAVGSPVSVAITTNGGGCTFVDSTSVTAIQDGFEITPYDRTYVPPPDGACPLILKTLAHDAAVTFETPGMHVIHVVARASMQLTGFTYQIAVQ